MNIIAEAKVASRKINFKTGKLSMKKKRFVIAQDAEKYLDKL